MEEKRRYPRIGTINLISYIVLDKNGNRLSQGMGTAQNISQNGLLIETNQMIDSEYISLLSNSQENNLIEILGKVIYCRNSNSRKFMAGVRFLGTNEERIRFAKNLVQVFNTRKNTAHSSYWREDTRQQSHSI
ncbi:MAG: PilZ domain-containing protein [Desulfobacterales bacterium]|jgi:hypothetical protein